MRKFFLCSVALALVALLSGCGGAESQSVGENLEPPTASLAIARSGPAAAPSKPAPIRVILETSHGEIVVELDREHAPLTVENFLQYVDSGQYDGTIFHQVNEYTILGGGYTADLDETPARTPVYNEASNGLKNRRGTIAMARTAEVIDSASNQFFINVADNSAFLDHQDRTPEKYGYCVFGRVVSDLAVVERISRLPVTHKKIHDLEFDELPQQTAVIKSARRLR